MKRAQVSLEFLVVLVIITAAFSVIVPSVLRLNAVAGKRLVLDNAENLLSEICYSCERAAITNEEQSFIFNALSEYELTSSGNAVHLKSEEISLSKALRFSCNVEMNLVKGKNNVSLESS